MNVMVTSNVNGFHDIKKERRFAEVVAGASPVIVPVMVPVMVVIVGLPHGHDLPTSPAPSAADVPARVSASTAQNLSVPIMFVCLLHLANEKHLKISNSVNMDDLLILQG